MDPLLAWASTKQDALITFLRDLVECESPSDDAKAVERCADLFAAYVSDLAKVRKVKGRLGFGPHLLCEFRLPGRAKDGQILTLGHIDTVYASGTLASMPFVQSEGKIYGPGVFDMKGGLAMFVFAMRGLVELDLPVPRKVILQINSDEEMGSPTSRALTEEQARKSVAVIVVEPAAGPFGHVKTERKGVGAFRVQIKGVAAHSGLDFSSGASAVLELARQLQAVELFTDLARGLTVNPGVIGGGTRSNVVPAEAWSDIDVRIARARDWTSLEKKFRALRPVDKRCTIDVTGALNRPPLEKSKAGTALYKKARTIAARLGVDLGEASVGGGSDGNFTAALGIPTLDGMGAVGDGAHTNGEYIVANRIADRVALLGNLVPAL